MNVRVLWNSLGWPDPPTLPEVARRMQVLPWAPLITDSLGTEVTTPAWRIGDLVIVDDATWGLYATSRLRLLFGKDSDDVYDVPPELLRGRITGA